VNFYLQAEGFLFGVERHGQGGDPRFGGYYVQGSWILTGETRRFDQSLAAFSFPKPLAPIGKGGWGALELAFRYSLMDPDDHEGAAGQPTPLGTGQGTLANVWAGFKVQVEVKDPLQMPMHAKSVDIQRAVDGGAIKAATSTSFTYTHPIAGDRTHAYGSPFTWWYLGYPGVTSTVSADFAAACTGAGDVRVKGVSDLVWNAGTSAWDARTAIFEPVPLPLGAISASYNGGQLAFTFTNSTATTQTITVNLNTTVGDQPIVLEVTKQTGAISVLPLEASTWATKLVAPAKIRMAVVPKPEGTFAAYSVVRFTGF